MLPQLRDNNSKTRANKPSKLFPLNIRNITINSLVDLRPHGKHTKKELLLCIWNSENTSSKLPGNSDATENVLLKPLLTNTRTSVKLCHNADAVPVPGRSQLLMSTSWLPLRTFTEISNPSTKLMFPTSKVPSSEWTCEFLETPIQLFNLNKIKR